MTGMKIDLNIIKGWAARWERDRATCTQASQVAAVMLSKVLAQVEYKAARVEKLMREIVNEYNILARLERSLACSKQASSGLPSGIAQECKEHRKRMSEILGEAEDLMNETLADHSIQAGGLFLEIRDEKSRCKGGQA